MVSKSTKDRLQKIATNRKGNYHARLIPGDRMPTWKRKFMFEWRSTSWEYFPLDIVRNAFQSSCYLYGLEIDYTDATKSESD